MDSQREAYDECVRMAGLNGWISAYTELVENGFDEETDFLGMLAKWKAEEVSAETCYALNNAAVPAAEPRPDKGWLKPILEQARADVNARPEWQKSRVVPAAPAPAAPLLSASDVAKKLVNAGGIDRREKILKQWVDSYIARWAAELEQVRKALKIPATVARHPKPPAICPECEGTRFISCGPRSWVCTHCWLMARLDEAEESSAQYKDDAGSYAQELRAKGAELEQVRKAFRNYLAGAISKRAAEDALGEKGKQ